MNSLKHSADFLLIGAGVMGLSLALAIRSRFGDASISVIEKESAAGLHASGRNSGVIHAGFYYSADSLKARFTRDGNLRMMDYCLRHDIPVNRCGKLVVAKDAQDLPALDILFQRAASNGVPVQQVDSREASEIEPRIRCFERALFSPSTASVNPGSVIEALVEDCRQAGIQILTDTQYISSQPQQVQTSRGMLRVGYVVNTAGLYADSIARHYGFAEDYLMLPFKGLYLYSAEPARAFRTHIYPVPDLQHPFLGVHFTLTVDGRVKIGPTAIPALWKEHYQGLENFDLAEMREILTVLTGLFVQNDFDFRGLAYRELKKLSRAHLVEAASLLATGIDKRDYLHWGKAGIRAQLFNRRQKKLEMDFLYAGDDRSFHLLNAVSPAFTCSLSLSEYLADQIQAKLEKKQLDNV